jgi:hypothetical protein
MVLSLFDSTPGKFQRRGKKHFHRMAPDFGSPPRRIRQRISGYGSAEVTPVAGKKKTNKMWNYFFRGPKGHGPNR